MKHFLKLGPCVITTILVAVGFLAAQNSKRFPQPSSAGATVAAAAKATAQDRQKNGDAQGQQRTGPIEILSDTQGIDFDPYLQRVLAAIRKNWYSLIPQDAKHHTGTLAIECKIHKDGRISDLKLVTSAGSERDAPAWGSIEAAEPFACAA